MPSLRQAQKAKAPPPPPPPEDIDIESEDELHPADEEDEDELESQMDVDEAPSSRAQSESVSMSLNPSLASTPAPSSSRPSPLKLKLKLGKSRLATSAVPSSSSGSLQDGATPERDTWPFKRTADDMEEDDFDELENDDQSVLSSSKLTARQAALVSGVETGHVQLTTAPSKKKKLLNEAELAARKTETAAKRKIHTEKKLEDDKTETINRLLKRQSAGTRRKKALEESQSAAAAAALVQQQSSANGTGYNTSSEETQKRPSIPCFRWISTSREPRPAVVVIEKGEGKEKAVDSQVDKEVTRKVLFSFSIPPEFLPAPPPAPASSAESSPPVVAFA